MLIIRNEQIESFQKDENHRLAVRIREWIQAEFSVSETNEELEAEIEAIIAKAQSYGLFKADDIATFVEFELLVLPGFDEDPRFNPILIDEQRSPEKRMDDLRSGFDEEFEE